MTRAKSAGSRSRKREAASKKPARKTAAVVGKRRSVAKKPAGRNPNTVSSRTSSRRTAPAKTSPKRPKKRVTPATPRRKAAWTVADLERLVRSLRSEKSRLHRRLSEMVQEIGYLRPYELRTHLLERQLAERDREIAELRARLSGSAGSDTAAG